MEGMLEIFESCKDWNREILLVCSFLFNLIHFGRKLNLIQKIFGKSRKEKDDEELMETWVDMSPFDGGHVTSSHHPSNLPMTTEIQLRNLITEIVSLKQAIRVLAEGLGKGDQIQLENEDASFGFERSIGLRPTHRNKVASSHGFICISEQ